jgi:hypothetical protein
VVAIFGALGGLGNPLPEKRPEIFFIFFLLLVSLIYIFLFRIALPNERNWYEEYAFLIQFLKSEKYREDFNLISIFLFLVSFEVIIFGYLFGYNPISILCIVFLILFLVWILGIFDSFPTETSTIQLKEGTQYNGSSEISDVYVIENNEKSVEFLQNDGRRIKINQDNIFSISPIHNCNQNLDRPNHQIVPDLPVRATTSRINFFLKILTSRNFLNIIGSIFALFVMVCINFFVMELTGLINVPLPFGIALFISLMLTEIPLKILLGIIGFLAFLSDNY